MQSESECEFKRNSSAESSTRSVGQEHCRKRLEDRFESSEESFRTILSSLNVDTRKCIRNGAERLTKTFNTVRVTWGTISQRFKVGTKRRTILEEGPMTPAAAQTPFTKSRQVLGRTPTKMYSPFGIDSPYHSTTVDKENMFTPK